MNKRKSFRDKFSLTTSISLGIMILGIGFIFWGMLSILRQPDYSITNARYIDLNELTDINGATLEANNVKTVDDDVVSTVEKDAVSAVQEVEEVLYPEYPLEGDELGSLIIPALNLELPIFQGTGDKELKKGVGHFIESVLPGEEDNSVLSGHRDTVFWKLGDLVIGDLLIVETSAGVFTYEVTGTRIVDKDDRTVIVPTEHAVLTVSTCYPFNYVGSAPDRYIVSADLLISE